MSTCQQCGAEMVADAAACSGCGAPAIPLQDKRHGLKWVSDLYTRIPHPHILRRKQQAPIAIDDMHQRDGAINRFNSFLAIKITGAVGTMWCAYMFALLALVSLPAAVSGGTPTLISWIAQTFLQLVLLSIIIVGQKVAGEASDKRAIDTYNDVEAIIHETTQIQEHLAAQDALLKEICERLPVHSTGSTAAPIVG